MYLVTKNLYFPPVEQADKTGILALGGDLSVPRLLLAYRSGIFPWYNEDEPIYGGHRLSVWWSTPNIIVCIKVCAMYSTNTNIQ